MKSLIPWKKKTPTVNINRELGHPFEMLHQQMNHLFDDFFQDFEGAQWPELWPRDRRGWEVSPKFDVSETNEEVCVTAELPGVDEKDVEVILDDNVLTVKGEKKEEREEKNRNSYMSERVYGQFQRTLPLPEGIDPDRVKAQFKKGVMTIHIPKKEEAVSNRKRIAVTAE